MVRALERGLSLRDFEELTVGMIIGYIVTYNNCNVDEEDIEREATQADFDSF
ncbi:hypothetical protein [Geosporobacter subterraneus]|nr:hypothetical protein [Geosporobacter subterraneus]